MLVDLRMKIRSLFERIFPSKVGPELLGCRALLKVGKNSYHNGQFSVRGDQPVSIGSYCAFGKGITINTVNHDYNYLALQGMLYRTIFGINHPGEDKKPPNKARTKGPVKIGSDVWIGDNVTILSGVTIGNGAIIANGSIVTRDIQDYSIAVGVPAKEVGKRYSEDKVKFINGLQWWNWEEDRMRKNKRLFTANLNKLSFEEIQEILV